MGTRHGVVARGRARGALSARHQSELTERGEDAVHESHHAAAALGVITLVVTVVLLHTLIVVVAVAGAHRAGLGTGLNSAGLNNAGLNNAGGLRRIRG